MIWGWAVKEATVPSSKNLNQWEYLPSWKESLRKSQKSRKFPLKTQNFQWCLKFHFFITFEYQPFSQKRNSDYLATLCCQNIRGSVWKIKETFQKLNVSEDLFSPSPKLEYRNSLQNRKIWLRRFFSGIRVGICITKLLDN